ncbi:hypothetical protein FRC08_018471 [Ceratobasidium sp. 394]|nr:hypothetical protein FRC08_018471 [Ceratobasidium sp. 394]KAG9090477.1 hypothetical protein FS749_000507 [Ceratobasidium sp. UAMH 11750]
MARHSPFASLSLQRRRAPPAALELTHSTFNPSAAAQDKPGVETSASTSAQLECVTRFEEEQARASAELEHTQAAFTASLEHEPLPGVRVRSPTAYRAAGKVVPMQIEEADGIVPRLKPFLSELEETARSPLSVGGHKFPLPDRTYRFPQTSTPVPRPSVATVELRKKKPACISIPWPTLTRILRFKGRRRKSHARALPEPLGFHERIKNSGHEWRPACSQFIQEDKGGPTALNVVPPLYA